MQALAKQWLGIIGVDLRGVSKVARELCEKSYNSSRKELYYGLKLHAVVVADQAICLLHCP